MYNNNYTWDVIIIINYTWVVFLLIEMNDDPLSEANI